MHVLKVNSIDNNKTTANIIEGTHAAADHKEFSTHRYLQLLEKIFEDVNIQYLAMKEELHQQTFYLEDFAWGIRKDDLATRRSYAQCYCELFERCQLWHYHYQILCKVVKMLCIELGTLGVSVDRNLRDTMGDEYGVDEYEM